MYYAADIWSDAAAATDASGVILRVVRGMEKLATRGAAVVLASQIAFGLASQISPPSADVRVVGHGVDLSRFAATGASVDTQADIVYVCSASEWHGAELTWTLSWT